MVQPFSWNSDTKCVGKGCPREKECERAKEKPIVLSNNCFLWVVYDKINKQCQAFKKREEKQDG